MTEPSEHMDAFSEQLIEHFGEKVALRVLTGLEQAPSVSLRLNPKKPATMPQDAQKVPWHKQAYLLKKRPNFALDPHFHAGAFYVQDSSSMILASILEHLELPQQALCLDACAAPGGKSSILLDHLNGSGFLIANEIDARRQSILQENLLKWGHSNVASTSIEVHAFHRKANFDLILVDAPCSGEGMFRKDPFARTQWGPNLVAQCKTTQQDILDDATEVLKEDGWLIYSTCTMNPAENEEQVQRLVDTGKYELATPTLQHDQHVISVRSEKGLLGLYLLPGISTGEGLFISVLRKTSPCLRVNASGKKNKKSYAGMVYADIAPLDEFEIELPQNVSGIAFGSSIHLIQNKTLIEPLNLPYRSLGLPAFTLKGQHVIPEHGLAMMEAIQSSIALNKEEALAYLRKEVLSLAPETERGWHVVSHEARHLGWLKVIERRTNNYYPGWLRLRI